MKHRHSQRTLGRKPHHRLSLLKNLSSDLLEHRAIVTTPAKAKEVTGYLSPLFNRAKENLELKDRRLLLQKLAKEQDLDNLLQKPDAKLRTTKVISRRHDGAPQVKIEVI